MGIIDIPYLDKISRLQDAIHAKKSEVVYDSISTSVPINNAEEIDVRGYDSLILKIIASGDISVRVRDESLPSSFGTTFLDIYDYYTFQNQEWYGNTEKLPGVTKSGLYIVPLNGVEKIKIPVYNKGESDLSLAVSLQQSFGGIFSLLNQSSNGKGVFSLDHSKYSTIVYSNANKHEAHTVISGNGDPQTEFFEPKLSTEAYLEFIDHASGNIFEQAIFVFNNTNRDVIFRIGGDFSLGSQRTHDRITNPFVNVSVESGKGVVFTSDGGEMEPGNRADVVVVPQLRMPFWRLRMTRRINELEGIEGDIYVQSVRRY